MYEQILQLIADYGLEAVIIAMSINILTGLLKLPIKSWASRMQDGTQLTKYLVFLPIILGFLLTMGYLWLINGAIIINYTFATVWLSSSSLSLSLYAVWEKLFPSKKKILAQNEIEENARLIKEMKSLIEGKERSDLTRIHEKTNQETVQSEQSKAKIILKGNQ